MNENLTIKEKVQIYIKNRDEITMRKTVILILGGSILLTISNLF